MALTVQALTNVLEKGCDPNYRCEEDRQRTLLHLAVSEAIQLKQLDKVRLLLKHKANANIPDKSKDERTPLREVVDVGNRTIARLLLRHDANPNQQSIHGVTSLHSAVATDNLEMVQLLLIHKANVSITDKNDRPPIFFAKSPIMCELLLDHCADALHVTGVRGECCLHVAAANGSCAVINFFLREGVPVDFTDSKQYTPLHKAARHDRSNAARCLLDRGADCTRKTIHGQTPIDIADAHDHNDLAFYLYCRHTGSNKAPLRERFQNPLLLLSAGIVGTAAFTSRDLLFDVFLDILGW